MRHHLTTIGLLFIALCLAVATPIGHARAKPDASPPSPYVVETRIAAPQQVGDFALVYIDSDSEPRAEMEFALTNRPEIRFILRARGIGDMSDDEALDLGVSLAEGSPFDYAFADSRYQDPQRTKPEPFTIPAPDPTTASLHGMRFDTQSLMKLDFLPERVQVRTRDFVFYKGMHMIHLSASAAESRIDREAFEALADRAARELVPALTVSNIGRCGEAADRIRRQCYVTRDEARAREPAGAGVATLAYKPEDWSSP